MIESLEGWVLSTQEKPESYKIIHAVSKVGKEYDIIEAWWTGSHWVTPSARSRIISLNIICWKPKPPIPEFVYEMD